MEWRWWEQAITNFGKEDGREAEQKGDEEGEGESELEKEEDMDMAAMKRRGAADYG